MPDELRDHLADTSVPFTLHANVSIPPELRGHALSLGIPYVWGAVSLVANGQSFEPPTNILDLHHTIGPVKWDIGAQLTNQPTLDLRLEFEGHRGSKGTLDAEPRLSVDSSGDAGYRTAHVVSESGSVVAASLLGILVLFNGVVYLLNRRRKEYGWFALQAGFVIPTFVLTPLGLTRALGRSEFTFTIAISWGGVLAAVEFAHVLYGRRPLRRLLWVMPLIGLVVGSLGPFVFDRTSALMTQLTALISLVLVTYMFGLHARLLRDRSHRFEAAVSLFQWVQLSLGILPALLAMGGFPISRGIQPQQWSVAVYGVLQLIILSRNHAARERENRALSDELRRQVADRSRELADALARLAKQPRSTSEADQVVDGRYRVVRKLGAGGMGEVHEVERISDRARFALKRLRGRADADALARFAREAQIAAEMHHPNLVPVVDVGIADGELFLVMPLVDGDSLEAARGKFGTDLPWTRRVLAEVATGLAALHDRGIVHRDLKPGNILLSGGVARIADFGLAYFADANATALSADLPAAGGLDDTVTGQLGRAGLTRAGDVFGTPSYMAPELARGVHAAAPASDVFAFGVIAFELATGRAPFSKPPVVVMLAGGSYAPPDTSAIEPSLRATVERCLAADPTLRPTTRELAAALTA